MVKPTTTCQYMQLRAKRESNKLSSIRRIQLKLVGVSYLVIASSTRWVLHVTVITQDLGPTVERLELFAFSWPALDRRS